MLVGINLLREGLDIPEVSLMAILDADKEGFLRSARSLIQTFGRTARNVNGTVIMYADVITRSMKAAMHETNRRRDIQKAYNRRHGITPKSIQKEVNSIFDFAEEKKVPAADRIREAVSTYQSIDELDEVIRKLETEMQAAARELEFERAAEIRDEIKALKKMIVMS